MLAFDIDGTLLQKAYAAHRESLHAALHAVHGIDDPAASGVEAAGRTDNEIARHIALAAGVSARLIDERADDVREVTCREYAVRCPDDLPAHVAPGIPDLLASLAGDERALPGAADRQLRGRGAAQAASRHRWALRGLPGRLRLRPRGPDRVAGHRAAAGRHLRGNALAAQSHGADRRHPRDIACARADGVRVLGVATGPSSVEDLASADGVAASAGEMAFLLERELSRTGSPDILRYEQAAVARLAGPAASDPS